MTRRENKTRYAVLGMLSFSEKSGYEIGKAIANSTAYFWSESDGQLYPILKRLCEEGLVEVKQEACQGKRVRKIYHITDDGEQALKDWLLLEPTTFNMRNEFLLQLFFGHRLRPQDNIEKIKRYQLDLKRGLAVYNNIEKSIQEKSQNKTYLLLSLSYGQTVIAAEIEWCDQAINILEDMTC